MKILKWSILIIVLLVVVGIGILYFNLNRIVRSQVQSQTQSTLKVDTSLKDASVSLFGGSLDLNQLQIGAPTGYHAQMFTLGKASVQVSYGQLRSDPVHVKNISLVQPRMTLEQANGKFNFQAVADNLPKTEPAPADKQQVRIIVDQLTIQDPVVVVRPGLFGSTQEITLPLQTISMQNVGSGEGNANGAAIQDVLMQVITTIAGEASKSKELSKELQGALKGSVADAAQKLGGEMQKQISNALGEDVGGVVGDVIHQATGGKEIGETVTDLLNKDRKKDKKKNQKSTGTQPAATQP